MWESLFSIQWVKSNFAVSVNSNIMHPITFKIFFSGLAVCGKVTNRDRSRIIFVGGGGGGGGFDQIYKLEQTL